MEVTKREVLTSIAIVAVMLLFGFLISAKISDYYMEKYQEYNTALQIENDKSLFEYGMRTNVGNAFVYGNLCAVDPVTYDEIGGAYSSVEKVKERYTMHTRTVTHTRTVNGKTETYTTIEHYWTWDRVDSWDKHCNTISFIGVEFPYGAIKFPAESYIDTIRESSSIRYVYYGAPESVDGTLYAALADKSISGTHFYAGQTIEETIDRLESGVGLIVFWVCWVLLIGGCMYGFYYLDNQWLEDR